MESFLQTYQSDFIPSELRNFIMRQRTASEIEIAMKGYFDASAKASEMCVELLSNIERTQSNYQSMDTSGGSPIAPNLFSATRNEFKLIHDNYSSLFQSIRSSHRKVSKKFEVVKAFKQLLTTKKKVRSGKTGSLLRLQEQLDAAAKGMFVLGKDFDTVGQLIARLSDDIERENAMAMYCMERASKGISVMLMVNELKRSHSNSMRLAQELEEHVRLCLATVHNARVLVIEEMSKGIICV